MNARQVMCTFLLTSVTLAPSVEGQLASQRAPRPTAKLTPIDVAKDDASLRTLRTAILKADDAKDVARLQSLLASHVTIDFDRVLTPAEVVQKIRGYSPSDRALFWQDLGRRSNSASLGRLTMCARRTSSSSWRSAR